MSTIVEFKLTFFPIVTLSHIIDSFIAKIVANEQIEEIATHQKLTGLLNVDGYSKRIRNKIGTQKSAFILCKRKGTNESHL